MSLSKDFPKLNEYLSIRVTFDWVFFFRSKLFLKNDFISELVKLNIQNVSEAKNILSWSLVSKKDDPKYNSNGNEKHSSISSQAANGFLLLFQMCCFNQGFCWNSHHFILDSFTFYALVYFILSTTNNKKENNGSNSNIWIHIFIYI